MNSFDGSRHISKKLTFRERQIWNDRGPRIIIKETWFFQMWIPRCFNEWVHHFQLWRFIFIILRLFPKGPKMMFKPIGSTPNKKCTHICESGNGFFQKPLTSLYSWKTEKYNCEMLGFMITNQRRPNRAIILSTIDEKRYDFIHETAYYTYLSSLVFEANVARFRSENSVK